MRVFLGLMVVCAGPADNPDVARDVMVIVRQGRGNPEGRAAWDKIIASASEVVPALLEGMTGRDTVADNWLRTAFDKVAQREMKDGGKRIDVDKLLTFVKDSRKGGRARRFALDLIEQLRPGISDTLYPTWLDDPEFRYEAVALALANARSAAKQGDAKLAGTLFRQAFDSARDLQQARDAAAGLGKEQGPSVARHLGFLTEWYLIGPFDGKNQKGFHLEYSPELKVDLAAELDGQEKKVRWQRHQVKEPLPTSSGRHQALVDLCQKDALGNADDAVAFAYSEFAVDKAQTVEFRGAADDNFTVWVNGQKVFGFEEWRNGVRHDRHRFPVKLREGKNAVLVKICQSAAPNPEPNWEFFLRVVDDTGKGIAMKNLLPK